MTEKLLETQGRFTPYQISIRSQDARFRRESQRIHLEQNILEKNFKRNSRKLQAAQRGVTALLGRNPYPECGAQLILFEQNQPGFCYKRNGEPRRALSVFESKTRKIVHDMEGKLGIMYEPASNVISDNPLMTEVLSSPEIVQILCDLRTTSAILDDPKLFDQFASVYTENHHFQPLRYREGEDPMTNLRALRTNLIQEFFDALQQRAEMRLNYGMKSDKTSIGYLWGRPDSGGTPGRADLNNTSGKVNILNKPPMSFKEWNEALVERLHVAQKERFMNLIQPISEPSTAQNHTNTNDHDPALDTPPLTGPTLHEQMQSMNVRPLRVMSPTQYGLRGIGIGQPQPGGRTRNLSNSSNQSLALDLGQQHEAGTPGQGPDGALSLRELNIVSDAGMKEHAAREAKLKKIEEKQRVMYRKNEFDSFVQGLISDVENVSELRKTLHTVKGKHPEKRGAVNTTKPLLQILRKPSLFSTLAADKMEFLREPNDLEALFMSRYGRINDPSVNQEGAPTPTTGTETESSSTSKFSMKSGHDSSMDVIVGSSRGSTTEVNNFNVNKTLLELELGEEISMRLLNPPPRPYRTVSSTSRTSLPQSPPASTTALFPVVSGYRSVKRVCCAACKAKLEASCSKFREKDAKDNVQTPPGGKKWKMAGRSGEWTKNFTHNAMAGQNLINALPIGLRKGYNIPSSKGISFRFSSSDLLPAAEPKESPTQVTMGPRPSSPSRPVFSETSFFVPFPAKVETPMPGYRGAPSPLSQRRKFIEELTRLGSTPGGGGHGTGTGGAGGGGLATRTEGTRSIFRPSGFPVMNIPRKALEKVENPLEALDASGGGGSKAERPKRESWTLQISKLDIMKLRHELDTEIVKEKLKGFYGKSSETSISIPAPPSLMHLD